MAGDPKMDCPSQSLDVVLFHNAFLRGFVTLESWKGESNVEQTNNRTQASLTLSY